jgi:hypothetical protein
LRHCEEPSTPPVASKDKLPLYGSDEAIQPAAVAFWIASLRSQ